MEMPMPAQALRKESTLKKLWGQTPEIFAGVPGLAIIWVRGLFFSESVMEMATWMICAIASLPLATIGAATKCVAGKCPYVSRQKPSSRLKGTYRGMIAGVLGAIIVLAVDAVQRHKATVTAPISESQYVALQPPALFPFPQKQERFAIPEKIPTVPVPGKQAPEMKMLPSALAASDRTRVAAPVSEIQYATLQLPALFPFTQKQGSQFAIPEKIPQVPIPKKQQPETKPLPSALAARDGTRDAILEMQKQQRQLAKLHARNGRIEPQRRTFQLARRTTFAG